MLSLCFLFNMNLLRSIESDLLLKFGLRQPTPFCWHICLKHYFSLYWIPFLDGWNRFRSVFIKQCLGSSTIFCHLTIITNIYSADILNKISLYGIVLSCELYFLWQIYSFDRENSICSCISITDTVFCYPTDKLFISSHASVALFWAAAKLCRPSFDEQINVQIFENPK